MKVFISWSGERSKIIAESLKDWIPKVIQAIEPWMSNEDISSGSRWSTELYKELEETKFGIICITPENQHNPWILFEAGALSKSIDQTYVIPYLFDMEPNEILGPLVQFQAARTTKNGTFQIVSSLNNAVQEKRLNEIQLKEVFDVWWHKLEEKMMGVPEFVGEKIVARTNEEILNEILENTREQLRKENLRLNSVFHKEDKMGDVMRSLQSELKNVVGSNRNNLSELLLGANDNSYQVNINPNALSFDGLDKPFSEMIKIMEEQKEFTEKLLDKNSESDLIESYEK
jgi:hypothetical protein